MKRLKQASTGSGGPRKSFWLGHRHYSKTEAHGPWESRSILCLLWGEPYGMEKKKEGKQQHVRENLGKGAPRSRLPTCKFW